MHLGFAVVLRETSEPIGYCGLSRIANGGRRTLLGWHFSNKFKGLGYATEAGRELIRVAFEERGVARVVADCYESSAASIRVFSKLGMRPVSGQKMLRWFLALKYRETRSIVRYAIAKRSFGSQQLAA
jgi:RimJ/RimL family protein N-acetyltransferase